MQYREKLMEFINTNNAEAAVNWIEQQPLLQQPDIIRVFKQILAEKLEQNGLTAELKELEEFDKQTDVYEDAILDEQLALLNYEMATEDVEKNKKEMLQAAEGMRAYAIECIVTNASNAPEMRELAKKIIQFEKDAGIYDAENWKGI